MTVRSYPLHWPAGWPRTETADRERARFHSKNMGSRVAYKRPLTIAEGIERAMAALERHGYPSYCVVVSTNMPVKDNGMPYSGRKDPDDPGAAVYWRALGDEEYSCIAIDRFDRLADNLAAIGGTIDALRAIERWGGGTVLQRATAGLAELPDMGEEEDGWWTVLGVPRGAQVDDVEDAYRALRRETHPDHGGNDRDFKAVQQAWYEFKKERGILHG